MESGEDEAGVPLSMIPLLEVAYSKCQEAENTLQLHTGHGTSSTPAESAGKKRKRSSNWSEAETLQLLLLRKHQVLNKDDRKICPKGSSAWDEIASQLKAHFTARSGKHVGERWDTLRRVYMDIEERSSQTRETYAEILDANREHLKFIPTEYTQKWHELIAECKPGKRRGKKPIALAVAIASGSSQKAARPERASAAQVGPTREDYSVTSYVAPAEAGWEGNGSGNRGRGEGEGERGASGDAGCVPQVSSPTSGARAPGIATAFGSLIEEMERVMAGQAKTVQDKAWGRKYARRGRDADGEVVSEDAGDAGDAGEMKVVASLQAVLAALKSASEFTSSESYLLKIDKREWNLVEHSVRAFSERHRNIEQLRISGVGKTFSKIVWPPDDPDPVTITLDDMKTLEPGAQLSDSIVNFYLRYLHLRNPRIPDVQIFKTFTKYVSANLNVVRYGSVRHWMKSIFDKNYVLIPVFKEEQWSLIAMCFPGRPIPEGRESSQVAPCILHLNPSRQKAHLDLERHMRFILHYEWLWHHGGHVAPPHVSDIPFFPVAVPQQENCDDTGVLVLQYAELLLRKGPESFSLAQSQGFPFLTDLWESSTAKTMRAAIRQVLLDMESQTEALQKQANGG